MRSYLITGGLGVVGSEFARERLREGHRVVIIDAAEEPRNRWMAKSLREVARLAHARFFATGDAQLLEIYEERLERMEPGVLLTLLSRVDFVVHAAAHTGIPHSAEDPDDDWRSNVDATRAILEPLRKLGTAAPRTVVISSVKPYDVADVGRVALAGVDETWPMRPDEPYAASKLAQSAIAQAYARSYDLPIAVVRCSNLYGPAPCHGPRHGWLTWFCLAAVLGRPIRLEGSGRQQRDVLFSADINRMLHAVLSADDGGRPMEATRGKVFNAGGGRPALLSVNDAAMEISKHPLLQDRPKPNFVPAAGRQLDDAIFLTNHDRLTDATMWAPTVGPFGPGGGIDQIIRWADGYREELAGLYRDVA